MGFALEPVATRTERWGRDVSGPMPQSVLELPLVNDVGFRGKFALPSEYFVLHQSEPLIQRVPLQICQLPPL